MDHSELDLLDRTIIRIDGLVRQHRKEDALVEIKVAERLIERVLNRESLSIKNIFNRFGKIVIKILEASMEQDLMINQIINFVKQNYESTASRAVYRRILGSYPGNFDRNTLSDLRDGLEAANPEEIESL